MSCPILNIGSTGHVTSDRFPAMSQGLTFLNRDILPPPSVMAVIWVQCKQLSRWKTLTEGLSAVGTGRQVAYVNQRHINEDKLLKANVQVINEYNNFDLPKLWGSGKSALADGTKWDVYEQNLLSEYYIRYGGWGGIGYYHVSDTYIALFSSFISCGVWEAVHILDGLLENKSDIRPDHKAFRRW